MRDARHDRWRVAAGTLASLLGLTLLLAACGTTSEYVGTPKFLESSPTPGATFDSAPPNVPTLTVTELVPGPRVTKTVLVNGKKVVITVPGPLVTRVVTRPILIPGPASTRTLPGQIVVTPGPTVTGPTLIQTLPGPTVTQTVTQTVTGPAVPGPTVTVTVPGPTVTVPGPGVTVTCDPTTGICS